MKMASPASRDNVQHCVCGGLGLVMTIHLELSQSHPGALTMYGVALGLDTKACMYLSAALCYCQ